MRIIAPLGAFAWRRQKNHVRVCVRPEKQRVLSRSFSTCDIFSFRGKGSMSDSARFAKICHYEAAVSLFGGFQKRIFLTKN